MESFNIWHEAERDNTHLVKTVGIVSDKTYNDDDDDDDRNLDVFPPHWTREIPTRLTKSQRLQTSRRDAK